MTKKTNSIKRVGTSIKVPIAVVFEDGSFLHSAMLSGNSL